MSDGLKNIYSGILKKNPTNKLTLEKMKSI